MSWSEDYAPYMTVAERRRQAAKEVKKLKRKGHVCQPIVIEKRTIAHTFRGKAWCQNLESYSDYSNRLPRGRTYVRNGSVIDLKMAQGEVSALVSGSSIYKVHIEITKVVADKWKSIVEECAGKVDSLIELLQGKFSNAVMEIITDPNKGLFPHSKEIKLNCSCMDWAEMCKHTAAVLYGIGARIDEKPEELFVLRQTDYRELIAKAGTVSLSSKFSEQNDPILADSELSSLFGIDLGNGLTSDVSLVQNEKTKRRKVANNKGKKVI